MDRPTKRRRSVARGIGMALAVGCYAAVLLIAAQLTEETTAAAGQGGAVVVTAVTAPVVQSAAPRGAPRQDAESPVLTLALAGAAVAGGGAWRLLRVTRRPQPIPLPAVAQGVTTTP